MKTVYVIGPVVRQNPDGTYDGSSLSAETLAAYQEIHHTLVASGFNVAFPLSEPSLEYASPGDFYLQIEERIKSSDLVITVLAEHNPSGDIEAAMASFMEKEQYVIAEDIRRTPRLLRGLPNVIRVAPREEIAEILREVQARHREEEPPPILRMG